MMDSREGDSLLPLHTDALQVTIVAENFLPKIDSSTITLAHLLQHLPSTGIRAMLLGPETGITSYAGASLFGTFGVPLRVYPGLKVNFISPAFLAALRQFALHVIPLVDPIWLGVQGLTALSLLLTCLRNSHMSHLMAFLLHHTNLPTYATVFEYPYYHFRTWAVHAYLHSFARYTLVPSRSTASLLAEKGFGNLRVVGRGMDDAVFHPSFRSQSLRASWGARPSDVVILSVGRLSPEKNLGLLVHAYAALLSTLPSSASLPSNTEGGKSAAPLQTHLVFVGDGPLRASLQALCVELGVPAIFTGQLTGRRLSEAFSVHRAYFGSWQSKEDIHAAPLAMAAAVGLGASLCPSSSSVFSGAAIRKRTLLLSAIRVLIPALLTDYIGPCLFEWAFISLSCVMRYAACGADFIHLSCRAILSSGLSDPSITD
ncbi:hypothetical protein K438DRAFT_1967439 [Mycena galopus ATCC 62051]|nr:hypothetical protein K438DRAFT_1967439 [Mycena galopus ATCC 62051]